MQTTVRTTIRIDEHLYRKAKAHAASTGRTVSEVIEDAVRAALDVRPPPEAAEPLPVFGSSGVLPGVDIGDSAALHEVMDAGEDLGALR